jgi:hypothetical protein
MWVARLSAAPIRRGKFAICLRQIRFFGRTIGAIGTNTSGLFLSSRYLLALLQPQPSPAALWHSHDLQLQLSPFLQSHDLQLQASAFCAHPQPQDGASAAGAAAGAGSCA